MNHSPLQTQSDKVFWHKYIHFYDHVLEGISPYDKFDILEIGVLNSQSIQKWRDQYPRAVITGCDIKKKSNWYSDANVRYLQFDQADTIYLEKTISNLSDPRILVDDGSHIPFHQLIFLHIATRIVCKLPTSKKRIVIIEDLHTSLEEIMKTGHLYASIQQQHNKQLPLIKRYKGKISEFPRVVFRSLMGAVRRTKPQAVLACSDSFKDIPLSISYDKSIYKDISILVNPFGLLLCLEKVKNGSQTKQDLLEQVRCKTTSNEMLSLIDDIITGCLMADRITIYRRSTLPDQCWRCGSRLFDPSTLKCQGCGENGYKHADSITASLEYNSNI